MAPSIQQQVAGVLPGNVKPEPPFDVAEVTSNMVKGDEMAYRIFYEAYFERLRRYLLVVTSGNEDATCEALQSALVRIVKHIRKFSAEAEFWGWLTVLARTALFDHNRKRKRYWSFLERFTRHMEIERTADIQPDYDTRLLSLLEQNLATLPAEEKQLLESKYIDGASVRQIADDFQTSEKAIESWLVRIRRKLKSALLENLNRESSS
ncbi:MAG TPA: sigma-70 family RNA polymerase sigma factor [Pirellulales bacterium]